MYLPKLSDFEVDRRYKENKTLNLSLAIIVRHNGAPKSRTP